MLAYHKHHREFNDGMRRTHGDMSGSIMGGREDMFKDMDNMMNSMMRGFGGNMVSSILVANPYFH